MTIQRNGLRFWTTSQTHCNLVMRKESWLGALPSFAWPKSMSTSWMSKGRQWSRSCSRSQGHLVRLLSSIWTSWEMKWLSKFFTRSSKYFMSRTSLCYVHSWKKTMHFSHGSKCSKFFSTCPFPMILKHLQRTLKRLLNEISQLSGSSRRKQLVWRSVSSPSIRT